MFVALGHLKLFARLGCNARFAVALQEVEVFHERVDWQVLSLADVLLLDSSLTFFQLTFALSNAFVFKLKVDPHLLSIESLHLLAAFFCVWQKGRSREADREKWFAGLLMSYTLNAVLNVIRDLDGVVVFVSWQAFRNHLVRHGGAERGHIALHDAGDCIARWTLKWGKEDFCIVLPERFSAS